MTLIFLLFTLFCKSGVIYDYPEVGYDPSIFELQGFNNKEYYFFEDIEMEDGAYLYISNEKDSVWFYVHDNNAYYVFEEDKSNEEFLIKNQ